MTRIRPHLPELLASQAIYRGVPESVPILGILSLISGGEFGVPPDSLVPLNL